MNLYDAVTASHIPADAQAVAGYANGLYVWTPEEWALFPTAVKLSIAISSNADADVLDVENGDATPADVPPWVQRQRARGADPAVYCSAAIWSAVKTALTTAGVPAPHYWIAQWDNSPEIPAGADAKQYAHDQAPGFDLSSTGPNWPKAPQPTPTPITGGDQPMQLHLVTVPLDANGNGSVVLDGGTSSTPGITSVSPAIQWTQFIAATPQGSDPAADKVYWKGTASIQERAGFLLVDVTGSTPDGKAVVVVTATI